MLNWLERKGPPGHPIVSVNRPHNRHGRGVMDRLLDCRNTTMYQMTDCYPTTASYYTIARPRTDESTRVDWPDKDMPPLLCKLDAGQIIHQTQDRQVQYGTVSTTINHMR